MKTGGSVRVDRVRQFCWQRIGSLAFASNSQAQLMRFLLVGGSFFVIFVALSTALISWGNLPPWISAGTAHAALVWPAFLAHRRLTFAKQEVASHAWYRYVALQVAALCGASASAHLSASFLDTSAGWISVLGALGAVSASFLVMKFWVFVSS